MQVYQAIRFHLELLSYIQAEEVVLQFSQPHVRAAVCQHLFINAMSCCCPVSVLQQPVREAQ